MAIASDELIRWLTTLPVGTPLGIDEGGLTLQVVGSPDVYLEVGGVPDEDIVGDPTYPRADWQYEVSNGDTTLGYAEWVEHKIESES